MARGIIIAGIILIGLGVSPTHIAIMFTIMMIGEINRQRTEDNLIPYFSFTSPKMLRIFSEYRRRYPHGKLDLYAIAVFISALIDLLFVGIYLQVMGVFQTND